MIDVPDEITLSPAALVVRWRAVEHRLSAPVLRNACRCAHCRQRGRTGVFEGSSAGLTLTGAVPVGGYGLQLLFSDGHDRGIYPWEMLLGLGQRTMEPVAGLAG